MVVRKKGAHACFLRTDCGYSCGWLLLHGLADLVVMNSALSSSTTMMHGRMRPHVRVPFDAALLLLLFVTQLWRRAFTLPAARVDGREERAAKRVILLSPIAPAAAKNAKMQYIYMKMNGDASGIVQNIFDMCFGTRNHP